MSGNFKIWSVKNKNPQKSVKSQGILQLEAPKCTIFNPECQNFLGGGPPNPHFFRLSVLLYCNCKKAPLLAVASEHMDIEYTRYSVLENAGDVLSRNADDKQNCTIFELYSVSEI